MILNGSRKSHPASTKIWFHPADNPSYWVVFAFFNVLESALSVTYWLPFYYVFKFGLVMWLGLPQFRYDKQSPHSIDPRVNSNFGVFFLDSGAQVVFRSFLQPVFAKRFNSGVPTSSANLRAKADAAADKTL